MPLASSILMQILHVEVDLNRVHAVWLATIGPSVLVDLNVAPGMSTTIFPQKAGISQVERECVVELVELEPITRLLWNEVRVRPPAATEAVCGTADNPR